MNKTITNGFKHGFYYHPLYSVWAGMRARCLNINRKDYKNYGGRGVKICKRWDAFALFVKDMGERPDGYTLERIDNDKGYFSGNCKWASRKEQNNNQRRKRQRMVWCINGLIFRTSTEAAILLNVGHATIVDWCKRKNKPDCYAEKLY